MAVLVNETRLPAVPTGAAPGIRQHKGWIMVGARSGTLSVFACALLIAVAISPRMRAQTRTPRNISGLASRSLKRAIVSWGS